MLLHHLKYSFRKVTLDCRSRLTKDFLIFEKALIQKVLGIKLFIHMYIMRAKKELRFFFCFINLPILGVQVVYIVPSLDTS